MFQISYSTEQCKKRCLNIKYFQTTILKYYYFSKPLPPLLTPVPTKCTVIFLVKSLKRHHKKVQNKESPPRILGIVRQKFCIWILGHIRIKLHPSTKNLSQQQGVLIPVIVFKMLKTLQQEALSMPSKSPVRLKVILTYKRALTENSPCIDNLRDSL